MTKKSLKKHRKKQTAKGMVRVEVQAQSTDAPLIREIATLLRDGTRRASHLRSALRRSLMPSQSLLELLTFDLPDDVVDEALSRPKDMGRAVAL